ncbi:UrcA family protein [Sphingomonas sp. M1-B02]|uniref:UrcA family protein n=1 Tax=Sphingomonas sp. M1-B02 TaxID=3114300 RepID=UPI00223E9152|nr:UrcA family protein [Sphingomonas sp. S6-11]UZK67599.1 UrcA family protein [Sphingomonas sp. S6-11]
MLRALLPAAACAAATLAPATAQAQDWRDGEFRSIRVDASALDLSTDAGVDELERRVGRAVSRICGNDRYCREDAWASTDEQVAWAIRRDEQMRRFAEERLAQLRACGHHGCAPQPQPANYAPPPPPPSHGGVTVTIIHTYAPPVHYQTWAYR